MYTLLTEKHEYQYNEDFNNSRMGLSSDHITGIDVLTDISLDHC